ncbi:hypothetical protein FPQ18DRAFT_44355 [Pyronema domesticum]|nr:hypothetical protein FPQ18DRAFT_44355 [Pyronema domesticum]
MPHEKDNNYLSPPTSPLNSGFDTIESPLPSPAFSYQSGDDFSSPYSPYGHASQTHANTLHQSFGADNLTRTISYDSPGSPSIKRSGTKKSAKDTAYFKEVFSVRDEPVVPKTAGIWVEFQTNINLHNTPTLLTSLTAYLAHRYKVPPLTILLDISHSSHLSLGGTSEGCYTLTVSAVHSISPTVNKRQAIMLQQWIWENLGLAANRGIIRFNLVECANWATGGDTVLGTMEKEEVKRTGTNSGMIRGMN